MNRLRTFAVAALVALALTACDEAEVVTPPAPPPTPVGTIGGLVLIEGAGATGVTVTLSSGATQATGAGGVFAFTGVEAGSYSVSISGFADDVTFTNTTQLAAINTDGQVVNLNFNGSYVRTSSIVGSVVVENRAGRHTLGMDGLGGLAGVTVRLGGALAMGETDKTGSSGNFSFTGLRAGTYTLTLTGLPANVRFASNEMSVEVGVGAVAEANFTDGTEYYEEGTLRGRLYLDGNENDHYEMGVDGALKVEGVVVTLEGGGVGTTLTTMTDSTGSFEFAHLEGGSYRVWVDARGEALKDANVELRGLGRTDAVAVAENSVAHAYFGFNVLKYMAKIPVMYGNDGGTENPAAGVEVMLYTQPTGVSGRKQIGKTAESDSMGIATIEVARSVLKDLPATSIVFAEVQDPATDDDTTPFTNENTRDVAADEVVTFTLDKSQFSTLADEDHNLVWREITVTANYVDQDGTPVPKALTADNDPTIPFLGDFWYQADKASTWSALPNSVAEDNDVDPVRISDKESSHDGAYQLRLSLSQVGLPPEAGNAPNPDYGKYGVVDVTNPTAENLVFREEGADADSTRSGVSLVEAKGTSAAKYDISANTFTGSAERALLSGAVDGSSEEVHLGDFVVSYPHPDVTFTLYRERNDIPGYQDSKANKANPDTLEIPTASGLAPMTFELRFTGAGLDDDSHGSITCTPVMDSDNNQTHVVKCDNAPTAADSWTLIAAAGVEGTPPAPIAVEDAEVRFMPLPFPGGMVHTHADSAATATATAPVSNAAHTLDVGTALEAITGEKTAGVLGWKYQSQSMTFTVLNETGVVASSSPPTDSDQAAGVADLTVTAALSESALGYNAARDTVLEVAKTGADGVATFTGLLEGDYTVTVVKHNVKTPRTMRAVLYDGKGKRTGEADLAGYASTRKVVYDATRHDTEEAVRSRSPHFQEVEFQGSISGHVFNAANKNQTVDGYETLSGYVVMAQRMKADDQGSCDVPVETDNRKKVGDPIAISTDAEGVYTFALWEGCYDITTDTTYTSQPDARRGFKVDETASELTRPATEAFAVNFNDGNLGTDFEIIHSNGSVVVEIKELRNNVPDSAVANMNVYLFRCKLGADVDKLGGTVDLGACDDANERTAVKSGLKTTAGNGTATWTNLSEGWYIAEPQPITTDGDEYNPSGATGDTSPVQVFQPSAAPVTEYIRLNVPKASG